MPGYRRSSLEDSESDFSGGLNASADDSLLAPNELRVAANCRLSVFGAVAKRLGTQRTSVAALENSPVRGGFGWTNGVGVTQQLAMAGTTLYTGSYAMPMTWTAQGGTLSSTGIPSFAQFYDGTKEVVYIADGVLRKWDGTILALAVAGTPAVVTQLAVQNRRLFGITGVDESLYFSDLDKGDTLGNTGAGGGFEVIRTFGKQPITALLPLRNSLAIFHREGISQFTGWSQDDIAINAGTRGLSSDTGTIAPHSIVAVENTGFFLTDRGFYSLNEFGVQSISPKIESVIRGLDQSQFARVQAVHLKSTMEVAWYLPDVGCYVYNYRLGSWTGPWTGSYVSPETHAMWPTVDSENRPIALSGHFDGFVRRMGAPGIAVDDALSDGTGGTPVIMTAQCRRMYFGEPETEKAYQSAYLQINTNGSRLSTLSWSSETGQASATLPYSPAGFWDSSSTWDINHAWGAGGSGSQRVLLNQRGKYLDVAFTDGGAAQPSLSRVRVVAAGYGPRY